MRNKDKVKLFVVNLNFLNDGLLANGSMQPDNATSEMKEKGFLVNMILGGPRRLENLSSYSIVIKNRLIFE